PPEHPRHHLAQVDAQLLEPLIAEDLEGLAGARFDLELHDAVLEEPSLEIAPELLARAHEGLRLPACGSFEGRRGRRRLIGLRRWFGAGCGEAGVATGRSGYEELQQSFLDVLLGLRAHGEAPFLADEVDGDLRQVSHDRLDVAADVSDLREARGLDLEEGRFRQARDSPGDLGLPDAGPADQDDVLRQNVGRKVGRELSPPLAVAERDRDGALRGGVADDVRVQLLDDLPRRQLLVRAGPSG